MGKAISRFRKRRTKSSSKEPLIDSKINNNDDPTKIHDKDKGGEVPNQIQDPQPLQIEINPSVSCNDELTPLPDHYTSTPKLLIPDSQLFPTPETTPLLNPELDISKIDDAEGMKNFWQEFVKEASPETVLNFELISEHIKNDLTTEEFETKRNKLPKSLSCMSKIHIPPCPPSQLRDKLVKSVNYKPDGTQKDYNERLAHIVKLYENYVNNLKVIHGDVDQAIENYPSICENFKSYFNRYRKYHQIDKKYSQALNDLVKIKQISPEDENSFFLKSLDSFSDYVFHYTSLENICSIVVDGHIKPYNFVNYGKGIFFHKIMPKNGDDSILKVIYPHLDRETRLMYKSKIKCAIGFKSSLLQADRLSPTQDLLVKREKVHLNDHVKTLYIIIRKSKDNSPNLSRSSSTDTSSECTILTRSTINTDSLEG